MVGYVVGVDAVGDGAVVVWQRGPELLSRHVRQSATLTNIEPVHCSSALPLQRLAPRTSQAFGAGVVSMGAQ